ncbi:MAG: replicative DNA helicase, partial [Desulfurellales bacterium]
MNNPESDRLPPHAPDAERGVLGCVIVDPGMFTEAAVVIRSPEWFYDLRHQRIWQTMGDLAGRGTFDFISIIESLRTAGQLEAVGGVEYLNQITDQIPSAKNLPNYLEIGTEKFSLRRTVQVCSQAIAAAYDGGAPAG